MCEIVRGQEKLSGILATKTLRPGAELREFLWQFLTRTVTKSGDMWIRERRLTNDLSNKRQIT